MKNRYLILFAPVLIFSMTSFSGCRTTPPEKHYLDIPAQNIHAQNSSVVNSKIASEKYGLEKPPASSTDYNLGLSLSGGGVRSAAFSIGVMAALHDHSTLENVEIISSVSGGSYALSWYYAQHYYSRLHLEAWNADGYSRQMMDERLFDPDDTFQWLLEHRASLTDGNKVAFVTDEVLVRNWLTLPWYWFNMAFRSNRVETSIHGFYRDHLSALYFRNPVADLRLDELRGGMKKQRRISKSMGGNHRVASIRFNKKLKEAQKEMRMLVWNYSRSNDVNHGKILPEVKLGDMMSFIKTNDFPTFVMNATANDSPRAINDSSDASGAVFEFTPVWVGSDAFGYSAVATDEYFRDMPFIEPVAISGAAVDETFPSLNTFYRRYLKYTGKSLGRQLPGGPYLADGGFSENLGAFSLIRRNCKRIIVADGEYEPNYRARPKSSNTFDFVAFKKLCKYVEAELGLIPKRSKAIIERELEMRGWSSFKFGPLAMSEGQATAAQQIEILYVKLSLPEAILMRNQGLEKFYSEDKLFPHHDTKNQDYSPEMFKAYRTLGWELGNEAINNLVEHPDRASIHTDP